MRTKRCSGFGLADLIVALGIVILSSAFIGAATVDHRAAAEKALCLNNLRQLATASFMYNAENKGNYPATASRSNPEQPTTSGARKEDWVYWQTLPTPRITAEAGLAPYLKKEWLSTLVCPSDDTKRRPVKNEKDGPYPYSYVMNSLMSSFPDAKKSADVARKVQQILRSSEKILFYEEDPRSIDDGEGTLDTTIAINLLSIRHDNAGVEKDDMAVGGALSNANRKGNVAFADGHVEAYSRNEAHSAIHFMPLKKPDKD